MYPSKPRRIGSRDFDFEGIYEFYKMLERREARERSISLWKLCMALSVPVVLLMFTYLGTRYDNWGPMTAALNHFL